MLSHILITVMCIQLLHVLHMHSHVLYSMQLLHTLHMHALAQARPTMSCICPVIIKFLTVDYNVYYAEELCTHTHTHTHLTHMHAPMHTRMHHAWMHAHTHTPNQSIHIQVNPSESSPHLELAASPTPQSQWYGSSLEDTWTSTLSSTSWIVLNGSPPPM